MKKIITLLVFFIGLGSFAQVGIGNTNPDPSSILDLTSTTQGMLAPRMTESERDAITSPANGLLIYQTNNAYGFYYWDGSSWKSFGGGGTDNDWTINGSDMYNANPGNVGIGNTNPETKLHVTGVTTIGSSGTIGATVELLNENFTTYTVNQNYTPNTSCTTSDGWESGTYGGSYGIDGSNTGSYLYISSENLSCVQNATAIVGSFSPTATSITISFDYNYQDFDLDDSFNVVLFNETTPSLTSALIPSTTTTIEETYSNTVSVIPGNSYSIRFQYLGEYDYGASIDNVLVTETSVTSPPTGSSYVFRLDDGQQAAGKVLTSDADGNATWQTALAGAAQTLSITGNDLSISGGNTVTLPSGGGGTGTYNFTNGLSENSGTVRLGGTLTNNTSINLNGNNFNFTGDTRDMMQASSTYDYIVFGGANAIVTAGIDGTTFRDSGNTLYTIDLVAGFYNGDAGGTAVDIGSIEWMTDGTAETFISDDFSPFTDGTTDLGSGNSFQSGPERWWQDVWANNHITKSGPLVSRTSQRSEFKMRGLSDLMKIESFVYREDAISIGSRISNNKERDLKIGFSAKNLLEFIPEAVKKSDWIVLKEGEDPVKKNIDNPNGIIISQIVPVTVRAIQEQQEIIEAQNKKIESLEVEILKIESLKHQISNLEEMVNKLISSGK